MGDHRTKCIQFAKFYKDHPTFDKDAAEGKFYLSWEVGVDDLVEEFKYCPFCGRKLSEDEK
jgi:hypothetical protein